MKHLNRPWHIRAACAASLMLVAGVWAFAQTPAASPAAASRIDLLNSTSPLTRQGAKRLLVDVTSAGKRLVAVGDFGLIVRSDDQGSTWVQSPSPTSVMLTAVTFVDERSGWAVGHDGVILATQDGGLTWARQFDGRQGDVQMLEAARAQLAQIDSEPAPAEAPPDAKGKADPAKPDTAVADAELRREHAEDAVAASESAIKMGPSRPLFAVRFFNPNIGLAAGAFGQLFHTEDGGKRWTYIGSRLDNIEALHLNGLTLTPEGDVLIAAEAGTVFRSRDMGRTWTRANLGYRGYLYGVLALPGQVLAAYGFNGHVFRSGDAGVTWKAVPSRTTKTVVAATMRGSDALLLDAEGQLLVSTDGAELFRPAGDRLPVRRLSGFVLLGNDAMVTAGMGGVGVYAVPGQGSKQ